MSLRAMVANDEIHVLGEGPFWDPIRGRLLWVDIVRGIVFEGAIHPVGGIEIIGRQHFGETTGAVAVSPKGDWLVAGQESMIHRDPAGNVLRYPPLPAARGGQRRLNDGKPDPTGRYLVGTLCLVGPSTTETLLLLDHDGDVRTVDDDLALSNGLAWSPDGSLLYSIDTERQVVFQRSYDLDTGATGPRKEFLAFSEGYPDGMTIDTDGHLWIAMWGLGEVRRYSPQGKLTGSVSVPAPHTSSVVFAGPNLDTLVITTATQALTDDQLAKYPDSGRLFTAKPGVRGLPQPLWSGLPLPPTNQ